MVQIKYYICAILMVSGISVLSQNSLDNDPEIIQNSIDYNIERAKIELEKYNYYEAQKKLDEAYGAAYRMQNQTSLGIISNIQALLDLTNEEPSKAVKSVSNAIEIFTIDEDYINLAESYKILGQVFVDKKDYKQAVAYFKSSKKLFQKEGESKGVAETLLEEGKVYLLQNDIKKARLVIEQALVIAKKIDNYIILSEALVKNAIVYNKLSDYGKATDQANEGLKVAKKINFITIEDEAYLVLSEITQNTKNFESSVDYLKMHIKYSDSINRIKSAYSTTNEEKKLLLEEIDASNKQAEKLQDDKDINSLTSILSVALITILSLLTLSLYKNNNIKLITNNMLQKKNTELIVAKEKAELASKTKANFLSTVTHELRTPLYAVTGLSSMLLEENPKPEQIQHLKSLKFSGDYLLMFINDILQINKIEANKVEVEQETFNLKEKITNIILALNNSAKDNNIKIHLEYFENLPENFIADQLKISQILINLIGNSIKFTKNGDIWIRIYKINQRGRDYTLRFEVEDNGIGISQEKQDNMFESFSQGSIQINRKYGGTGLGLSIVKGLIDILKGEIYVKSELNKGTTFYFEIPLEYAPVRKFKEEEKVAYFESNDADLDLTNVKILIVEDNKINQMITKKILTKMNLKCDIVDNGEDSVEIVKTNKYDIILMDIHMPGISGIEATKQIRVFNKELTIFALTAVTIEDKMQEFNEAGFTDIIPKPFKQEEFEKKLYNALSRKVIKSA